MAKLVIDNSPFRRVNASHIIESFERMERVMGKQKSTESFIAYWEEELYEVEAYGESIQTIKVNISQLEIYLKLSMDELKKYETNQKQFDRIQNTIKLIDHIIESIKILYKIEIK